ncbi:MAG: Csu type fimbrial protein [Alcanivorax sediminis]|uniref:Csu type fimbrial protein n=1 Tax=Alcanivorax sediminis TaxID=2663008 RepID=UPI003C556BDE
MKKSLSLAALSAAMLSAPLASQAATATGTFDVLLTLIGSCTVSQVNNVDFGTQTEAAVNTGGITAAATLGVTCSNNTAYTVGLSGTNGARFMTSANGSSVEYELFQTDGTTAWDSTNTEANTGSSAEQTYTVNGNIPAQTMTLNAADAPDGTGIALSDTVTVTVTF